MSTDLENFWAWSKSSLFLGTLFWLINFVINITWFYAGDRFALLSKTFLLPLVSILIFEFYRGKSGATPISLAFANIFGIWLLGPLFMLLMSISSGRLPDSDYFMTIVKGTLVFPFFTWMISAYDGTMGGLIILTIILPLYGLFRYFRNETPA